MEKTLCFSIDGRTLYLEHVLIDYEHIPVYFLCKDEKEQYYVCLCTDIQELSYIVVSATSIDVYMLLNGSLTMRAIIEQQANFWQIISGYEVSEDIVALKPINQLDTSSLPEVGAYFSVLTKETEEYVAKFNHEFLTKGTFHELSTEYQSKDNEAEDLILLPPFTGTEQYFTITKFTIKTEVNSNDENTISYVSKVRELQKTEVSLDEFYQLRGSYSNLEFLFAA